jgi:ribosomal protein S27AE
MKTCRSCNTEKPISEFYVHPRMRDGHLSFCKDCVCKRVSEHSKSEYGRQVERAWLSTPKGRAKQYRNRKRMRGLYPEKYRARVATHNAIRDGRLAKGLCERCGASKVHAHHDDYSQPLNVRWLCQKHHYELHHKPIS